MPATPSVTDLTSGNGEEMDGVIEPGIHFHPCFTPPSEVI
jgi:hypothetical protein